jgi:hypothetical protein
MSLTATKSDKKSGVKARLIEVFFTTNDYQFEQIFKLQFKARPLLKDFLKESNRVVKEIEEGNARVDRMIDGKATTEDMKFFVASGFIR